MSSETEGAGAAGEDVRLITGEDLARAAAADFESFFYPGMMAVPVAVEPAHFACTRTDQEGTRVVISPDMAHAEITSEDRFFLHLLIIGHEIAHLVHKHGQYKRGENPEVDRNMEYWADFYGAKVSMAISAFGPRVGAIAKQVIPEGLRFPDSIDSIGEAINVLVKSVYADDSGYPSKAQRVGLVIIGLMSHFRRTLKKPNSRFYTDIALRMTAGPETRSLMILHADDLDGEDETFKKIRDWHLTVQGDREALAPGLKPQFLELLHTTFNQTDEELEASKQQRLEELRRGGYDV